MQHEKVEVKLLVPFPNDCISHKNLCGMLLPYPWFGSGSAVSKSKVVPRNGSLILDVVRGLEMR